MPRSVEFRELLIKRLKNKKEAAAYLNAILEECKDCKIEEANKLLMAALKDIAEAQGGMSKLSEKTGLGRESLYKTLSPKGNPRFNTLNNVINALGIEIKFCIPSKR